jgi:hypothetical protein
VSHDVVHDVVSLLTSIPWFGWVAIAGICFGSLSAICKMKYEHAERMEMIRQGIHPDGTKPPKEREV